MKVYGIFIFFAATVVILPISCQTSDPFGSDQSRPVETRYRECDTNDDCMDAEECSYYQCLPACESHQCGSNAICHAKNHSHTCSCPAGLTGDPLNICRKICVTDNECADDEKCNHVHGCLPVCEFTVCGVYASCIGVNHSLGCTCSAGETGDPYKGCTQSCTVNKDCKPWHKCNNNKCIDACESFNCGPKQFCFTAAGHTPECRCSVGYGVPLDMCEKYCEHEWHCDISETCQNNECTPI